MCKPFREPLQQVALGETKIPNIINITNINNKRNTRFFENAGLLKSKKKTGEETDPSSPVGTKNKLLHDGSCYL